MVLITLSVMVLKLMNKKKNWLFRLGNFATFSEYYEHNPGDPDGADQAPLSLWPLSGVYIFQYIWDLQQFAHIW